MFQSGCTIEHSRPCQRPHSGILDFPGARPTEPVDARENDIPTLATFLDGRPECLIGGPCLCADQELSPDPRPSPWALPHDHDVQIGVLDLRERARDRRGAHHQDRSTRSPLVKSLALANAEPMLFINHHKLRALKRCRMIHQGVRADKDIRPPMGLPLSLILPVADPTDGEAKGLTEGGEPFEMLTRKQDRRCHQHPTPLTCRGGQQQA